MVSSWLQQAWAPETEVKSRCGCQAWAEGFEAGSSRREGERGAGLRGGTSGKGTYPGGGVAGQEGPSHSHCSALSCRLEGTPVFLSVLSFLLLTSHLPVFPALQTLQLVRKWEPELVCPSAWNSLLRVATELGPRHGLG